MQATQPRSRFGQQLQKQLETHQSIKSVRRLAHVMAGPGADRNQVESERRKLQMWVSASGRSKPSLASRRRVAEALGVDTGEFSDPDDDEEEANRLNTPEGYCLFMTGQPLDEGGPGLVAHLRAEARRVSRKYETRAAELEEAMKP